MTSTDLLILADRVEGLSGPDVEVDADIYAALGYFTIRAAEHPRGQRWMYWGDGPLGSHHRCNMRRLTYSLDAAASLIPAGAAVEMAWSSAPHHHAAVWINEAWHKGFALTRENALVAACLRTIAANQEKDGE